MRKNKKGGGLKKLREEKDYDYDYDHGYDAFLNSIDFKNVQRSSRSNKLIINTKSLGNTNQGSYTSKIDFANPIEFEAFVSSIEEGPQIVSVPVPSFRHAFLVNVLPNKIMISDWKGNEKLQHINRRLRSDDDLPKWDQYYDFMKSLKNKYNIPIKFYIVNDYLQQEAITKNGHSGGGGCSEYIYSWVEGILNADKTFFSR